MPHVCFHCGQIDHVKRFCPLLSGSGFVGQFSSQPRAPVHGFGRSVVRPNVSSRSEVVSSSRA